MCKCCVSGWSPVAMETVCSSFPSGRSWNTLEILEKKTKTNIRGKYGSSLEIRPDPPVNLQLWSVHKLTKHYGYSRKGCLTHARTLIVQSHTDSIIHVNEWTAVKRESPLTSCTWGSLAKDILARAWVRRLRCCPASSPSSTSTSPAHSTVSQLKHMHTIDHNRHNMMIIIIYLTKSDLESCVRCMPISSRYRTQCPSARSRTPYMLYICYVTSMCTALLLIGKYLFRRESGEMLRSTRVLCDDEGHSVGALLQSDEATLPVKWLLRLRVEGVEPANTGAPENSAEIHRHHHPSTPLPSIGCTLQWINLCF